MTTNLNSDDSYSSIQRLELMFRRPPELTALPATINLLNRLVDSGADSSALELTLAADPGLAARYLKLNGQLSNTTMSRSLDMGAAIRSKGPAPLKEFLSSTVIGGFVVEKGVEGDWEPYRFSRHCLFVGAFCSRYAESFPSPTLSPSIALTVGVLHDIGIKLLISANAPVFRQVCDFSRKCGVNFDIAFSCVYPRSLQSLAALSCSVWRFGSPLSECLEHFDGAGCGTDSDLAWICRLGDWLAHEHGFGWETWTASNALPPVLEQIYSESADMFNGLSREAAMMANQVFSNLFKGKSQTVHAA